MLVPPPQKKTIKKNYFKRKTKERKGDLKGSNSCTGQNAITFNDLTKRGAVLKAVKSADAVLVAYPCFILTFQNSPVRYSKKFPQIL